MSDFSFQKWQLKGKFHKEWIVSWSTVNFTTDRSEIMITLKIGTFLFFGYIFPSVTVTLKWKLSSHFDYLRCQKLLWLTYKPWLVGDPGSNLHSMENITWWSQVHHYPPLREGCDKILFLGLNTNLISKQRIFCIGVRMLNIWSELTVLPEISITLQVSNMFFFHIASNATSILTRTSFLFPFQSCHLSFAMSCTAQVKDHINKHPPIHHYRRICGLSKLGSPILAAFPFMQVFFLIIILEYYLAPLFTGQ